MPPYSLVDGYQYSRRNTFPLSGSTLHISYTVTTEETDYSETSVNTYRTKRRFVPQRHYPASHQRDLNSHTFVRYQHFPLPLQASVSNRPRPLLSKCYDSTLYNLRHTHCTHWRQTTDVPKTEESHFTDTSQWGRVSELCHRIDRRKPNAFSKNISPPSSGKKSKRRKYWFLPPVSATFFLRPWGWMQYSPPLR
jgi:hypothetical protein